MPGRLTGIAERHHRIKTNDWQLLTPRHAPADDLRGHLEFALKWEGVDLGVLSALFRVVPDEEVSALLRTEPTGAYTRRLWFLHEWLTQRLLDVPEPGKVRAIPVIDLRSEEHTSELQSQSNLVCRLLLEKKKTCITHRRRRSRGGFGRRGTFARQGNRGGGRVSLHARWGRGLGHGNAGCWRLTDHA